MAEESGALAHSTLHCRYPSQPGSAARIFMYIKRKHLKKVLKTQVIPVNLHTREPNQSSVQEHCNGLSVPVEAAIAKLPPVSSSTLSCMWSKAADLIRAKGHVLNVPWLPDPKARLVESSSSPQLHVLTTKEGGIYVCASNCPMFKGFSLWAHVVAEAEVNGDLSHFLDAINKHCSPNLTAIASAGFSGGSGRKGGIPKRKRIKHPVPIESRSIRQCLQSPNADSASTDPTGVSLESTSAGIFNTVAAPTLTISVPTFPLSTGFSTISTSPLLSTTFPTVTPQACTLPQAAVVTSTLAPATCTATVLQPTSFPMAGSAQLPTSTYCPVSSVNQSGGQVIVNGSGQPTSFPMAGSAQLPTSTYCPVSSVNQSGGQVIVIEVV